MNFWKNIEHSTRQQIQAAQGRQLRRFVNTHVYPFSPYYRRLFDQHDIDPRSIHTLEDLRRIPITSKVDLIETPNHSQLFQDLILQPDEKKIRTFWPLAKKIPLALQKLLRGQEGIEDALRHEFQPVLMTFTSGTTQLPMSFFYTNHDIQNLRLSGARMMNLLHLPPATPVVNMFPYAPHLAFWQVVFGGFRSHAMVLSTGGGKVLGTQGNLSALLKMKPTLIIGVPSYVYHVLRVAKEEGHSMEFLRYIMLGASRVGPGFKEKTQGLLNCLGATNVAIMGTYGFTESRCAWAECPSPVGTSSGYHLYSDKEIFEIIDPETKEVKDEGEDGEIVYTALDARGSVVLRYRTGDFVCGGITYEPCPYCHRHVPRLSSDITRLSNIKDMNLSKIKGSLVNLNHFDGIFGDIAAVDEWQVELCKKNDDSCEVDELHVFITLRKNTQTEAVTEEIQKRLTLSTEISPNTINVIPLNEMLKRLELETANKEKRIVDRRPKD